MFHLSLYMVEHFPFLYAKFESSPLSANFSNDISCIGDITLVTIC